jgi:hypothetical protein
MSDGHHGTRLAGLLLAGTLAGCATPDAAFTVRRGAALDPGPAVAPVPGALRVLHLADFGDQTPQQAAVAGGVAAAHARAPFALALFPGDNLYPCGPDAGRPGAEDCAFAADASTVAHPPTGVDPRFDRLHEGPLAGLAVGAAPPVYLALGNHDVATWPTCGTLDVPTAEAARRKACAEVAHRGQRWRMPARHYVLDQGPARFVVIDSNVIYADYGGFTLAAEVAFVQEAVRGCEARHCFLVGHHPPTTAGTHVSDFSAERSQRFSRLLQAAGPSLRGVLAGHDHDLQHLRTATGLDVFVSGNGSSARINERFERVADAGELLFATVRPGYAVLSAHASGWDYRFEDAGGAPLYCCTAAGSGRCQPTRCAP